MAKRPDDELILLFYGEHPAPEELERALEEDVDLRRRYDALRGSLAALGTLEAPEPREGLEQRMWARVQPDLVRPRGQRFSSRVWLAWGALAAAMIAVAVVAFLAGRSFRPPVPTEIELAKTIEGLTPEARDRVLTAALQSHLESSERFLVEVSNGSPAGDAAGEEQRFAAVLLSANRLYQRAAEKAGQRRIAAVLAELEPLYVQLANGQPEQAASGLRLAQERIEGRDLLFKVRVTRNLLKELS